MIASFRAAALLGLATALTPVSVWAADCRISGATALQIGTVAPVAAGAARVFGVELKAGEGVIVVLNNQVTNRELVHQVRLYNETEEGAVLRRENPAMDWRQIGLGAQILADVGVRKMRVMSNRRKYHAISGFGLEVVEYVN